MNLLLVRHGEIPSNVNKVYAGRSPEKLTERGNEQAEEVSRRVKSQYYVDSLYSSPIQRAVQTAKILSETFGVDYLVMNEFREIEMGPWEGLAEKEVSNLYPEDWNVWNNSPAELKLPGRETLAELLERALMGVKKIRESGHGKTVVVVTHVAVIRVLWLWHNKKTLNLYKAINVPNARVFEMHIESFS